MARLTADTLHKAHSDKPCPFRGAGRIIDFDVSQIRLIKLLCKIKVFIRVSQ